MSDMFPLFSLIIPVYNVFPYLRECLDSVLIQTYADWEAICVDDGSTDGSSEILDEYKKRDERIIVIHQKNGGVSAARNSALNFAKGVYLVYIDADDYVEKDYLEKIAKAIRQENFPDIIRLGGYHEVSNDGREDKISYLVEKGENVFERLCSAIVNNSSLCVNIYNRITYQDVRFPLGVRYGEDDVYLFRMLKRTKSIVQGNVEGYYYRFVRVGAASRTITCHDMAILLAYLKKELLVLNKSDFDEREIIKFDFSFVRKCFYRVSLKSARWGTKEFQQALKDNIESFGCFYRKWEMKERIQIALFLSTGSWFFYDMFGNMCGRFSIFRRSLSYILRKFRFA